MLGTVKVQRKPNNLRIGKTAAAAVAAAVAAVAAAVAVKKEQRLPCLRTRRPIPKLDAENKNSHFSTLYLIHWRTCIFKSTIFFSAVVAINPTCWEM